jgi:hypothetical protein
MLCAFSVVVCLILYVRSVQRYTKDTGSFYTGWWSPNTHRHDPYSTVPHLDPVLNGPAFREYARSHNPELFS